MTKAAQIAEVIREQLLIHAKREKNKNPVVALSAGVDSCACLAALMEVGAKPIIVSYTPSTHESTDFRLARQTAENLGLAFHPAVVGMDADNLEAHARDVISYGFKKKVQVESLSPMLDIVQVAAEAGGKVLFTGDQSDGYFALSQWAGPQASRHFDIPREQWIHIRKDPDPKLIDWIRRKYYANDQSCSGAVATLAKAAGLRAVFPFRDKEIFEAFLGSVWRDVNKPRIKEPIRLAFDDWFARDKILVLNKQVNLHKGDSKFGDTFGETLLARFPEYRSPRGLYGAMFRGDV